MLDIPNQSLRSVIREGIMAVTPAIAERIIAEAHFDAQRRIEQNQVAVYAEMMRRNLWFLTDPLSFALVGDKLYLVNGRHRISAIIAYGKPVEFRIAINEVDTEQEAHALYYRFDTVMRRRSTSDILNAIDLAGEYGVGKSMARAVYGAVGVIVNGFSTPNGGRIKDAPAQRIVDLRVEACKPFWPAARLIERSIQGAPHHVRSYLMTPCRLAVALMISKHQPLEADEFLRGISEDDGLKKNDPRKALLKDMQQSRGRKDAELLIPISTAWNAFFEKREITQIKVAENMKLRISGTPIRGRS